MGQALVIRREKTPFCPPGGMSAGSDTSEHSRKGTVSDALIEVSTVVSGAGKVSWTPWCLLRN